MTPRDYGPRVPPATVKAEALARAAARTDVGSRSTRYPGVNPPADWASLSAAEASRRIVRMWDRRDRRLFGRDTGGED